MALTELDKKLQLMASSNWPQFVQTIGADAIVRAKICLLRKDQFSYGQIAAKLSITEGQARYACNVCVEPEKKG
jgi:hypothetical protein